ncbi:MAG: SAF domain-containing protein [Arachnia sp.]
MTLFRSIASFVSWHRRAVGALLAALAVFTLTESLSTPPARATAVVLTRAVAAGAVLSSADVAARPLPPESLPDAALSAVDDAVGRPLAVAAGPGTVLQPSLLGRVVDAAEGRAIVPIVVPQRELKGLLSAGDHLTLVAALGEVTEVVTDDARVVTLPPPTPSGGLQLASADGEGTLLVDVPVGSAARVAVFGQAGQLAVVLRGG